MDSWKIEMLSKFFPKDIQQMDIKNALAIKHKNIPSKLYKYQKFDTYSKMNLLNSKIWLSAPEDFNDPFDCALTYSVKDLLNQFFSEDLKKIAKEIPLGKNIPTKEEMKKIMGSEDKFDTFIKILMEKNDDIIIADREKISSFIKTRYTGFFESFYNVIKNQTIVSCFSEVNDSIAMWSHYANYHKGFCLKYNFKSLPYSNMIYPIIYQDGLLDVTEYMKNMKKESFNPFFGIRVAITKSKEWAAEKEWRIILPFGISDKERELAVPLPAAIYAGTKMEDGDMQFLKDYSNRNDIPFYRSKTNKNEFKIDFEREI
jgi:hypothetical protein